MIRPSQGLPRAPVREAHQPGFPRLPGPLQSDAGAPGPELQRGSCGKTGCGFWVHFAGKEDLLRVILRYKAIQDKKK